MGELIFGGRGIMIGGKFLWLKMGNILYYTVLVLVLVLVLYTIYYILYTIYYIL